jgi:L-rhamnonate dehydratase
MTEARRIVALAAAYDIPIIPHGSSIYSYHLQICFPSCPMAEFLVMSPKADAIGKVVFAMSVHNFSVLLIPI